MSTKPIPCFTVICDICGVDASAHTEFVGMTNVADVRDIAADCDWLCVPGVLDICDSHGHWAEDNDHGHCYSCDEDDAWVWLGNCSDCWHEAFAGADA